jgi:hypothetical protein
VERENRGCNIARRLGVRLPLLAVAVASRAVFVIPVMPCLTAKEPPQELSATQVLDRMEDAARRQQATLEGWTSIRVYRANSSRFGKWAEVKVQVEYSAPEQKTYRVLDSSGSQWVAKRVIFPVLDAECQSAAPPVREQTDIDRSNYAFRFVEFDAAENAYVFDATPHRANQLQFRGRIWVDAETFGIHRVTGEPAVSPSFWVKRSVSTRIYRQFGTFWLPVQHRSSAELRWLGSSTLDIDYQEYRWPGNQISTSREDSLPNLKEPGSRLLAMPGFLAAH